MGYKPDRLGNILGTQRPPGEYPCFKCGESYSTEGGKHDRGICRSCFMVEFEAWTNGRSGKGEFIDGVWYKHENAGCMGVFATFFIFLLLLL